MRQGSVHSAHGSLVNRFRCKNIQLFRFIFILLLRLFVCFFFARLFSLAIALHSHRRCSLTLIFRFPFSQFAVVVHMARRHVIGRFVRIQSRVLVMASHDGWNDSHICHRELCIIVTYSVAVASSVRSRVCARSRFYDISTVFIRCTVPFVVVCCACRFLLLGQCRTIYTVNSYKHHTHTHANNDEDIKSQY